ncbi:hypothetical protein SDC9_79915 [bioreactor metagenome]|uniref:Uncharacterized protein n=1 Tax=bioreactor metagenome TaxID=1076179 RepID=A0A644YXY5_9ZZZZ
MYFVADNEYAVFKADFGDAAKLALGPDPARGVVGRTEEKERIFRVSGLFLKVCKIKLVVPVNVDKGAVYRRSAVLFDGVVKGMICRSVQQHALPFARQLLHRHIDGCDDPARKDYGGEVDIPIVFTLHPADDGGVVLRVKRHAVPQNPFVKPSFHGVKNRFGAGKVHIGNPHRYVFLRKRRVYNGGRIILDRVCILPADNLVEVPPVGLLRLNGLLRLIKGRSTFRYPGQHGLCLRHNLGGELFRQQL